jgi:hypothetical protein
MAAVGTPLPWTAAAWSRRLLRNNDRGDCIGSTGRSLPPQPASPVSTVICGRASQIPANLLKVRPRIAHAGGPIAHQRHLEVIDAGELLHDAFAAIGPGVDAEREVSSHGLGHGETDAIDPKETSSVRKVRRCRSKTDAPPVLRRFRSSRLAHGSAFDRAKSW